MIDPIVVYVDLSSDDLDIEYIAEACLLNGHIVDYWRDGQVRHDARDISDLARVIAEALGVRLRAESVTLEEIDTYLSGGPDEQRNWEIEDLADLANQRLGLGGVVHEPMLWRCDSLAPCLP